MPMFLGSPSEIRARLRNHMQDADHLDLAVAFVSSEWLKLFEGFRGTCRLVCWLRTTNTNPYAVEEMMKRTRFRVRHMDAMHAKVYLCPDSPGFAIVGSANISNSALSTTDTAGQVEAAIETTRESDLDNISEWFDNLWAQSFTVSPADLTKAKAAWDRRPKPNRAVKRAAKEKWKAPDDLKKLAAKVRHQTLAELRMPGYDTIHPLAVDHLSHADLVAVVDALEDWAGHRGVFAPLIDTPLPEAREAFALAFDSSIPDDEKMRMLITSHKLPGLSARAWSMILSWREPTEYVPFNKRSLRFIKDMGLTGVVSKSVTPLAYGRWMAVSRELATRLRLPTTGHVDRMVWKHTEHLDLGRDA